MVYVDTSVLAAYYCPEPLSEQAEAALRTTMPRAVSDLTEVELCGAVGRKVREGGLARADALKILARFRTHLQTGRYASFAVERGHYQIARDWLKQLDWPLRTLDALHLAVAMSTDSTVLTADHRMARCARAIEIPVELLGGRP